MQGRMWIDRRQHHANVAPKFEERLIYGQLEDLFVHQFRGKSYNIALVRRFRGLQCDRYGLWYGKRAGTELLGVHELMAIPVVLLDGLVGAIPNTELRRTYIMDSQLTITVPGYTPFQALP